MLLRLTTEQDNGVKVIDPTGEMLEASWEEYATKLANLADPQAALQYLEQLAVTLGIALSKAPACLVLAGRDTRKSSPSLQQALMDGVKALGAEVLDAGEVTTPELHSFVAGINSSADPVRLVDAHYKDAFLAAFRSLTAAWPAPPTPVKLVIDAANGVGAANAIYFAGQLPSINATVVNTARENLNEGCGADFVKTGQRAPALGVEWPPASKNMRFASFDGDADRVVFYYGGGADGSEFRLLDGDKIAALIALHLGELVRTSGADVSKLSIGVVQTAYANGSSTQFLRASNVKTALAKTGVKYLHAVAHEFDIGIYFEANGHGTVLFSDAATAVIKAEVASGVNGTRHALAGTPSTDAYDPGPAVELLNFSRLINQTVGDALSDMLVVEAILWRRQMTSSEWDALYNDLPNVLAKVVVPDRGAFTTTNAETTLVTPSGLQDKINEAVRQYPFGRSFVRPSGTEDVVRVYAEADTKENAVALSEMVVKLVADACQ